MALDKEKLLKVARQKKKTTAQKPGIKPLSDASNKPGAKIDEGDFRTADNAAIIFEMMADGWSFTRIVKKFGWKKTTCWDWLQEKYSEQYARAVELRAETFAEEMFDIADDDSDDWYKDKNGTARVNKEAVARSNLRWEARRWYISKVLPKFSDKVKLEHGVDMDNAQRLREFLKKENV